MPPDAVSPAAPAFLAGLNGHPVDDAPVDDPGYLEALLDDPEGNSGAARALVLPEQLWSAHPTLGHIRQAAHSRGRSPSAVLGCGLTRLCSELPPTYVLPAIVGSVGSLNLAAAIVGPSGAGKSSSDGVAGELLQFENQPTDPRPSDLPLGSGEGIAEAYMGSRAATEDEKAAGVASRGRIREQLRWRQRFVGDEGEAVMAQRGRQGSTLMPALRTLVTGGPLGQQNAAVDNRRLIGAHRYRAGVLLGFQTTVAIGLLDDAAGGTPQRFAYFSAIDESIPPPDHRPAWPGTLTVPLPEPSWREHRPATSSGLRTIHVADDVARIIQLDDHARQTGASTGDALDAHRNLVRLKVAAMLGLLTGELAVTDESWHLAGLVMTHSRAVVDHIVAHRGTIEREQVSKLALRAVAVRGAEEDADERRAFESAIRSASRAVRRHDEDGGSHEGRPCTRRCVTQAIAYKHRQLVSVDAVVAELLTRRLVVREGDHFKPGRQP